MCPRTLPFTWTASSTASSRAASASATGQAARTSPPSCPSCSHISSDTWGVKGFRSSTSVSSGLAEHGPSGPRRQLGLEAVDLVHELHERGHRGVEVDALVDVLGDARDRLVHLAPKVARGTSEIVGAWDARGSAASALRVPVHQAPHPVQEPVRPLDAVSLHSIDCSGRRREEDVEPQRVRAVLPDDVVGGDRVALRLGHDLAVLVDHALREEARDRLVERDEAEVAHDLRPEARVHEVQDRVLDPPHVEVDREPVLHRLRVEGAVRHCAGER